MIKKETIYITGMTCINCQNRIKQKLKKLSGIKGASVDYVSGTAKVTYNDTEITLNEIYPAIESEGYTISKEKKPGKKGLKIVGALLIIIALSWLLRMFSTSNLAVSFPLVQVGMSYTMILLIGLLTSVHCIAMCGGFAAASGQWLADSEKKRPAASYPLTASLSYNCGRIISYTAVGAAAGAIGSVITISDQFRYIIFLIAGIFMIIMGLNMLGIFPFLRRITPRLPQFISKKFSRQKANRGPLLVGIFNGFIPCGPLQAMQLYALSTGSPISGGISMFLFCMGTIPLMFILGAVSSILGRKAMQAGAFLVTAMGVVMLINGLASAGISEFSGRAEAFESVIGKDFQIIESTLYPNRYPAITVQKGRPVRWIINAPRGSINGCNYQIKIPEYGIEYAFNEGENVIEFMPENAGSFPYFCWMYMMRSTITVTERGSNAN